MGVVVDGDSPVDWYVLADSWPRTDAGGHVRVGSRTGGAAVLAELVRRVVAGAPGGERVCARAAPRPSGLADDPKSDHSWAVWSPTGKAGGGWRVVQFLGTRPAAVASPEAPLSSDDDPTPSLVVLDDLGLGYRADPDRWPKAVLREEAGPWIVLKTTAPVVGSALWDQLSSRHRDRLVVVVPIADLRHEQVQVSRGISWERTAQDLAWELTHSPALRELSGCAHTIVSFGASGAMVRSRCEGGPPAVSLVFDPQVMEGELEAGRPGAVPGAEVALTAFVAAAMLGRADHSGVCAAVGEGVTAGRALLDHGFDLDDGCLAFPFEVVRGVAGQVDRGLAQVSVRDPSPTRSATGPVPDADDRSELWTILEDTVPTAIGGVCTDVVERGADRVLRGVPLGRFGRFLTVDRREIEALRAIRALMEEYCALDRADRPLSIAVFGPPGSGKSFGVTQAAASVLPGRLQKVEFNLSQFESPDALIGAVHQVRDVSLSGQVPLVFWDEFDTPLHGVPLGWLRYFLAPMQDGAFREGQIVHPIGRAIFVFAGGTAASMHDFGRDLTEEQQRTAKRPDFVSRLRGYLDVLGPNPHQGRGTAGTDRFYRLRRAMLLESLLRRKAPLLVGGEDGTRLDIDAGVLRAFLEVPLYRHGARSMEAVIDMSRLAGHHRYERSCLPSEDQLDLHVDGRRFLALVHQLDLAGEVLERLARAAHEVFRAGLERDGYRHGAERDEERKLSPQLCEFDDLLDVYKEQNRANVRDIPGKLASVGYVMVAAKSGQPTGSFPPDIVEELAQAEHDRWMAAKLADGWSYGVPTDEVGRRHDALVPWVDLPESQREKDRLLVAGIAEILGRCGYAVVPTPGA